MSRTYRRHSITEHYRNIEAFEKNEKWWWSFANNNMSWYYPRGYKDKEFPFSVAGAEEWFSHFRDGAKQYHCIAESKFRKRVRKELRKANRRLIQNLKKDLDYSENNTYVDDHAFKHLIWAYD